MNKLVVTAMMVFFALPIHADPCKTGYSTTFIVQDPSGSAVSGAKIQLHLQCGDKKTVNDVTNGNGEATFPYSLDDLGEINISLSGFGVMALDKANCSGPDNAKRCVIKFGT
jgi:hypothetical protein